MSERRPIRSLLIANRGEIAVRIIRACRELGISVVSVFSEADATKPHVLMADNAYCIGPPPSRDSYLRIDRILDVAATAGVDAIHPGYGFLAENPDFADHVAEAGFIFVGPSGRAIRAMGDKTAARRLVRTAGVPTVPGTDGPLESEKEAIDFCRNNGYPVLLKAAAGGGGKGMRIVRNENELEASIRGARSEAGSAFGDSRIYIEKYLEGPRHIEFQIMADSYGSFVHLGERECSVQRRHQKIVEESPSAIVDEEMREAMGSTAVKVAAACGYQNAGTIEFLVDQERKFYFLEMNTRLQVEHPVTELRTGIDIVKEQIRIAEGHHLSFSQETVRFRGHAIECRICAEDVDQNYIPSTGRIVHLRPAQGPGIRDDRGVEQGDEIPLFYDSMIAKLIVWAETRDEAIRRMLRALGEYQIVGVKTNIPLCSAILRHEKFAAGEYDTHFLPQHITAGSFPSISPEDTMAAAAVCAMLEHRTRSTQATAENDGTSPKSSRWKVLRQTLQRD